MRMVAINPALPFRRLVPLMIILIGNRLAFEVAYLLTKLSDVLLV